MPAATSPYDFVEEEEQAIGHDVGARVQGASCWTSGSGDDVGAFGTEVSGGIDAVWLTDAEDRAA